MAQRSTKPLRCKSCPPKRGNNRNRLKHVMNMNKAGFAVAGALAACALLATINAGAETTLSVGSQPGFPTIPTPLPVLLRDATNAVAVQFDLTYTPHRVLPGQTELAAALPNHVIRTYDLAPGLRRVLIYSRANTAITNRNLANTTFTI